MAISLLLAQFDLIQRKSYDFFLLPGLLWITGMMIWGFLVSARRSGPVPKWRWFVAYAIILLSAGVAWKQNSMFLSDAFYSSLITNRRAITFIYISYFFPFVLLAVMATVDMLEIRRIRNESE